MNKPFWQSDWFAGIVITIVFALLANSTLIQSIERDAYDFGMSATPRTPNDQIAIIGIDDKSLSNIGRWPWPRDVLASLQDTLTQGGARVIGQSVFFLEPQQDPGLRYISELLDFYQNSSLPGMPAELRSLRNSLVDLQSAPIRGDTARQLRNALNQLDKSGLQVRVQKDLNALGTALMDAEQALNTDVKLAQSIDQANNLILAMPFLTGQPVGKPAGELPGYVRANRLRNVVSKPASTGEGAGALSAIEATPPIDILGSRATGIGSLISIPDIDGGIRYEPLVVDYYGDYYPSMALLLAMKYLNLGLEDVEVRVGEGVRLGGLDIRTDGDLQMYAFFYSDDEAGNPAFQIDSFYDVLVGNIPAEKYRDKIVLIGAS